MKLNLLFSSPELNGVTIGKTILTYVYIEKKNLLQNQQANFSQTWYKLSLGKVVQIKGQVLLKG
jgi:hypothetical protein